MSDRDRLLPNGAAAMAGKESQIVYALIARGTVVLTEYTHPSTSGNFPTVTRVLLPKIDVTQNERKSYAYDSFVFHYVVSNGITYLCMADEEFRRRIPFAFLEDIRSQFVETYGDKTHTAIAYAMNDEFKRVLQQTMRHYNGEGGDGGNDQIKKIDRQLADVRSVMVQNIEKMMERGEKIELLVDKADHMKHTAFKFRRNAQRRHWQEWWNGVKMKLLIALVILIVIYIVIATFCGPAFQCMQSKK